MQHAIESTRAASPHTTSAFSADSIETNSSARARVKPSSCLVRTNFPRHLCPSATTSLSSTIANTGHASSSSPCVARKYASISITRFVDTAASCATLSALCGSPAVFPTTRSGRPCRTNAYAKYSLKYLQYVVNTISASLRSSTSRKSITLSSSSAICFAVAVSFSTPSTSRNSVGRADAIEFVRTARVRDVR